MEQLYTSEIVQSRHWWQAEPTVHETCNSGREMLHVDRLNCLPCDICHCCILMESHQNKSLWTRIPSKFFCFPLHVSFLLILRPLLSHHQISQNKSFFGREYKCIDLKCPCTELTVKLGDWACHTTSLPCCSLNILQQYSIYSTLPLKSMLNNIFSLGCKLQADLASMLICCEGFSASAILCARKCFLTSVPNI